MYLSFLQEFKYTEDRKTMPDEKYLCIKKDIVLYTVGPEYIFD